MPWPILSLHATADASTTWADSPSRPAWAPISWWPISSGNTTIISAILVKALADRLAEALAEALHKQVREEWNYGRGESLSHDDLIEERYRGIRPAPGYPACPDHTEKRILFDLLGAEQVTDIRLTENFAMYPAAAVSGWYFAHPQSRYFAVDRIARSSRSLCGAQGNEHGRSRAMARAEPGLRSPGIRGDVRLPRRFRGGPADCLVIASIGCHAIACAERLRLPRSTPRRWNNLANSDQTSSQCR